MFFNNLKIKILIFFIVFSSVLSIFPSVLADDLETEELSTDLSIFSNLTSETNSSVVSEPITNSKYIIAIDRLTENILYEKNSTEKVPMASTTKIMTCILAIESSKLDDIVTISKKAASTTGSTLGIKEGMNLSLKTLLYGLMLRSGNDCAVAIAEHISGSVENFSIKMNEKASSLGLKNTHFTSPHGLDDNNHYTTACELAILTNYALSNNIFREIVSTKNIVISLGNTNLNIYNTNELLGNLEGVYGVKTGFTFNAGRCLVSSCKRGDLDVIVVVLGADTKNIRTKDSISVINYVFSNYKLVDTKEKLLSSFNNYYRYYLKSVTIEKSSDIPILKLEEKENYTYPILKKNINDIKVQINCMQKLSFMTKENSQIGTISVYNSNKLLYTVPIYIENNLSKHKVSYYFVYIFKNYFNFMYI